MILLLRMRWLFFILAITAFGGGWAYAPLFWLALVLTMLWGATWLSRPPTPTHGK